MYSFNHRNKKSTRKSPCALHSFVWSLSYGCEVLVKGKGLFVTLCLHRVGVAQLEGGVSDETGAALQGEGYGDGVEQLVAFVDRDRFVLHNIETDEQDGGLLGMRVGGHRRHLAHAAANGEDGAALNHEWGKVAVQTLFRRTYLTPGIDGATANDDSRVCIVLRGIIVAKRHEESVLGIRVHGIVALAASYDVCTIELNTGIGVDGIVGSHHIYIAAIEHDTVLTLDALGTCGSGTYGDIAAVDSNLALRGDAFG